MARSEEAAASESTMNQALEEFDRDVYAQSATSARASQLRTWVRMHTIAFSTAPVPTPPFPHSHRK